MSTPAITEPEVRGLLDAWSRGGAFRARALGSRSELVEVAEQGAFTIHVRTQYEERRVTAASTPYEDRPGGARIDDEGEPPAPWAIPVRTPANFEEREVVLPVPHTDHIETCPSCAGRGFGDCRTCAGVGQVACPGCGGTGQRAQVMMRPQPMWNGRFMTTIMVPYTIMVACVSCSGGGRVTCADCAGSGHQDCRTCAAFGTIKAFRRLTVTFRAPEQIERQYPDGLALAEWRETPGEAIATARAPRLDEPPPLPENLDAHAAAMLREAQRVEPDAARVLFQELIVERVPIVAVRYRYRGGRERRLWLVGAERRVVAPDAPRAWGRALLFAAAGLLALGALAAWMSYTLPALR